MTEDKKNPADGPGEALIDEPTEHALDPAEDPNTEWEAKAAEQIAEGEGEASSSEPAEEASSEGSAEEASSEGSAEEASSEGSAEEEPEEPTS